MHVCCHLRTCQRSVAKLVVLLTVLLDVHSRQKSAITTISIELLDGVKALAALDPAGCGLDDACAQLEGSTYVMADEARLQFQD